MKYFMLLFFCFMTGAQAADLVRLEGISIQGNSEEPGVMYIMPWQAPPGTGRLYQPVRSYRDQWLTEISRDSFQREIRYAERYARKPDVTGQQAVTDGDSNQ